MSVFDDLGVPGKFAMFSSECYKSHEKLSLGLWNIPLRTKAIGVFLLDAESFSNWDSSLTGEVLGNPRVAVVAERVLFLKVLNLRINLQWAEKILRVKVIPLEEKTCWIFSTISLLSSIFPRTVDVAPAVDFRWSWYPWQACDVFFEVSQISREVELGPVRYDPANRGCRSIFHDGGSFSDRDSDLTEEAIGDPRVTCCSWSYPFPLNFKLAGQLVVSEKTLCMSFTS